MADEEIENGAEEESSGPVSRRKVGNSKSGWCLSRTDTDEHERCPVTVGSFTCACTCENHGSRAGEEPAWIGRDLDLLLDNPEEYGMIEETSRS